MKKCAPLALLLCLCLLSPALPQTPSAAADAFVPYVDVTITASADLIKAPANQAVFTVTVRSNHGGRSATAQWLRDGVPIAGFTNHNFILSDERVSQYTLRVPFSRTMTQTGTVIAFTLSYDEKTYQAERFIAFENFPDSYYAELEAKEKAEREAREKAEREARERQALAAVQTIRVEATVNGDTAYYSDMQLKNKKGTLPKGTAGIYDNYYQVTKNGTKVKHSARLTLSDGRVMWVPYYKLTISTTVYSTDADYTEAQKLAFVHAKGYTSQTGYLIWISLKTQRVNLFSGKKGQWTLTRVMPCATGRNTTPTIAGVFRYHTKVALWDFGSYYVKPVLIFNGGHAMHSRTYVKKTGALLDPTIGKPASAGCVRMLDEDILWLSANLPKNTTVVVF